MIDVHKQLSVWVGLLALMALLLVPAGAQAAFGINQVEVAALNSDGTVDLQAGSHPYEFNVNFKTNLDSQGQPAGTLRDFIAELPPGLVGNPLAVPRCTGADFEGLLPNCPVNTQIGYAKVEVAGLSSITSPVYNLTPPMGVPASFGFSAAGLNSFSEASLRTGGDYGLNVSDITLPTSFPIQTVSVTIWGVPADSGHDPKRGRDCLNTGCRNEKDEICPASEPCPLPSDLRPAPFLTLPTSCTGPLKTTIKVDSVEEPGVFQSTSVESLGEGGDPEGLNGCEAPPFEPKIIAQPETTAAGSPTGLHFNLHSPQNEDPEQLSTANLKDAVVTLPKGLVINPSALGGLGACSSAEVDLHGPGAANCPASSKVGTVKVETPALDHPVPGVVYIAKQGDNPFNSLLALYIAIDDPISGIIVKLAGKVELDPVTGQLTTSFRDNPQLPVEDFDFDFTGGPRAALTTPSTCGTYTTTAVLTPWTAPQGADVSASNRFQINSAAAGGPCVNSEAQLPNRFSFEAGTVSPLAEAYSPFVLKLSRENGSQQLRELNFTLPPGLSARVVSAQRCSEAQIAVAEARKNLGEGALEKASPSCPQGSELGTVTAGAGSGTPFYIQGHAYLAGPYKGAPLSTVIITPAVAGPFDVGTVVVRAALYVNEATAQVTAKSDPLPRILQGVPVDLRSVQVSLDRSQFTFNPTSCAPLAVSGQAISTQGQTAPLTDRFQVGGCGGLAFQPKLGLSLKGGTKRGQFPSLRAVLQMPEKGANIARVSVALPHSEFLAQEHIRTICTRVQYAAHNCPPGSVYGKVKVFAPRFSTAPFQGPVYLRSSSNPLPDMVFALKGPPELPIELTVVGRIDSVNGGIRSTFRSFPDAPFAKAILTMRGGKKGLLVNSRNLCATTNRATARYDGQNGKSYDSNPPLQSKSCAGKSSKSKRQQRSD